MKKILFFFLMLTALLPAALKAQESVEILGDGGTTTSYYLPLYSYYNNTLSEQIYTADEIGTAGSITSISFYNGGTTKTPNLKIYLVHTDMTEFSTSSSWLTVTTSDLVYEGDVTFTAEDWTVIEFSTPFDYDGSSNLGVVVDANMIYSSGLACRVFTSTDNCSMYVRSDGTDYDAVGATYTASDRFSVKNQIILEITPAGGVTCAKPTTLTVSDITSNSASVAWTDAADAGNYILQYKTAAQNWDDEDIFIEYTSDTETELTDLLSNTTYNVRVASVCGDETSLWRSSSFRTECGLISSVPVTWDFESGNIGGTSSYPLPACWSRIGTNYPYAYNYDAHSGSYCLYSSYNPFNDIAILPAVDFEALELNTLQLRFFAKVNIASDEGMVEVGLMTNPSDANSFTTIGSVSTDNGLTDEHNEFEFSFADYDGELENPYIALRLTGTASGFYSSQYVYVDDITLEHIPSCSYPESISVSNVTSTSADITINDSLETDNYRLYILGGEEPDSMDVGLEPTPLTGLTPGTTYTVSAATICDDGTLTRTVSITFNTMCEAISSEAIPYVEDFDSYTNVPSDYTTPNNYPDVTLPSCWTFLNRSMNASSYPIVQLTSSSYYAVSGNCLFFKSSRTNPLYAILPPFEENLQNLMLTFYYRNESTGSYNGNLSVGYMTNPFDATSFVELYACPQNTTNTKVEQLFNIVPEDIETAYIAFRYTGGAADNYFLSIDSVAVDFIPDCIHPAQVTVDNITSNSAEISIVDPNEVNNYHVIVKKDTTTIVEEDILSATYPLTNLDVNTTYTVSAATICEDGTITPAVSTTFTTQCTFLTTLPQIWDFDSLNTGGTSDSPLPACWSRIDSDIPYVYTGGMYYNYAHSDYSCLANYGDNMIVVLPGIDNSVIPVNTIQLSFYAYTYQSFYVSSDPGTIEVGVMTDPLVETTFTPLVSLTTTNSYEYYEIPLNMAPEDAEYIALRISSGTSNLYIDDVALDSLPSCVRPSEVIVNDITENSAIVSIVDANEVFNYRLYVFDGTTTDTIDLQDTTYELTELPAASIITISAVTVCDDGSVTNATTTSFQTSCELITADMLPKTWDFESNNIGGTTSYPLPACWSRTGSTYPYVETSTYYSYAHSGDSYLYTYTYNPSISYVVLPEIDVENVNLNTLQLRFFAMVDDMDNEATITLGVMSDPTNISTFTPVSSVSTSTGITAEYDEFELSLAGYEVDDENEGAYIALRINLSGYYDEDDDYYYSAYLYIDDFVLETLSPCPRPNNFSVSAVTQTSVTLSWDDDENVEGWNVAYGPVGFNPNSDDVEPVSANENTATIENLTSGTAYDFYVQANCGGDDVSNWRGPINAIPGSYNMPHAGTDTLTTCDIVIYDDGGLNDEYSTNCDGYLVLYPEQEGSFMQVTGSFNIEYSSYSRYDYLQIFDGDNASGTLLFDSYLQGTQQGNLTVVSSSGPLTLYFHSDYSSNFDGLELHASCVTCAPPAFTVATTSATEAVVTITSDIDSWDLVYGETGFNPEEGVVVENLTNTTYTASDLEASTSYDFYVRTNCEDGESDWVGPVLISTPCLSIIVTNDDPFVEDFNTLTSGIPMCWDNSEGTTTNDSYKWSYNSNGETGACVRFESYLNTTANTNMLKTPLLDISALSTPTLRFSYKNPAGGDFSVYLSTDGGATYTSAIAVGLTNVPDWTDAEYTLPDLGNASTVVIVFRGISNYGTGSQTSCSIYLDNVYVGNGDTVGPGPQPVECNAPTNVTATNITKNSAVIDWIQEGTPVSWTVSYKKADAQTWTAANVTAHPYTITDLDAETAYNVKVTANCDDTTTAESNTVDFTTLPDGVNEYVNSTVIFPNPTTGQFTISNTQCVIERVEVMDVYGKLLNTVEVNDNTAVIDVTSYASGVYFTRIHTDKGVVTKRVVKE